MYISDIFHKIINSKPDSKPDSKSTLIILSGNGGYSEPSYFICSQPGAYIPELLD